MNDTLNKYRVFPRLFSIFYLFITYEVIVWAMLQPDLTTAQSNLVIAVNAAAAAFFKFYVDTGGSNAE